MLALWLVAGCQVGEVSTVPMVERVSFIPATDQRLHFSDGLRLVRDETGGTVHFDRLLDVPDRGFRWDSPGSRMRWRTDSEMIRVHLRYTDRHTGSSRNSIGVYRIDGRNEPEWRFSRPVEGDAALVVEIPADGQWRDYELILPYGDSLELLGVEVSARARWGEPVPRPERRLVAFGDSVTHGFTASEVTCSYAFQLAERIDCELVNLGIGGRGTRGSDGAFLGGVEADLFTILIGVNDWQGGADLATFRQSYEQLLDGLRGGHPDAPVYVITPLWVPPSWQPESVRHPLEDYRQIIRDIVVRRADPRLILVDGPSLIEDDPSLFDPIAVHPNDAGFHQMAERLALFIAQHPPAP